MTQASFWGEDPTSNGQFRHNGGEQGPRQTAARYLTSKGYGGTITGATGILSSDMRRTAQSSQHNIGALAGRKNILMKKKDGRIIHRYKLSKTREKTMKNTNLIIAMLALSISFAGGCDYLFCNAPEREIRRGIGEEILRKRKAEQDEKDEIRKEFIENKKRIEKLQDPSYGKQKIGDDCLRPGDCLSGANMKCENTWNIEKLIDGVQKNKTCQCQAPTLEELRLAMSKLNPCGNSDPHLRGNSGYLLCGDGTTDLFILDPISFWNDENERCANSSERRGVLFSRQYKWAKITFKPLEREEIEKLEEKRMIRTTSVQPVAKPRKTKRQQEIDSRDALDDYINNL